VCSSAGEFSCAKGGYVGTKCGWFSDRSACYLAAGRPVVVQETGFDGLLPTGKGLFSVRDTDEAVAAIHEIRSDYQTHSSAARQIAQEHFDSDVVLRRVLAAAGIY
jgi:glycosyltransferase involved in cell wall biosynthesis